MKTVTHGRRNIIVSAWCLLALVSLTACTAQRSLRQLSPAPAAALRTLAAATPAASSGSASGIISAQGTHFVDKNCHEFVYSGANVWQIVEAQAGVDGGSPQTVDDLFSLAQQSGLNVIRFFPFGIFEEFTLQTAPGQYNDKNWDALDAILQKAAQHDVKVIMPFADNWTPVNGKAQYVQWAGKTDPDSFYKDADVKTLYKNHIRAMATHVNKLTNIAYKDDPTIFAWDLMNEMRSACDTSKPNVSCTAEAATYMQSWVEEISAFVKKVDPNHLVTVGEEGFYGHGSPKAAQFNPGQDFAIGSGQDFVNNHRPATIDYAVAHVWIDNWSTNSTYCGQNNNPSCGPEFVTRWVNAHAEDAAALNKPFVIEEFGNNAGPNGPDSSVREPIFKAVYQPYINALDNDTFDLRGVAFWQWEFAKNLDPAAVEKGYIVATNSQEWNDIIAPSFKPTQDYNEAAKVVPGCTPGPVKATTSANTVQTAG